MPAVLTGKSQTEHIGCRFRNDPIFALLHLAKHSLLDSVCGLHKVERLKNLMLLLLVSFSTYVIQPNPKSEMIMIAMTAAHIYCVYNVPGPVLVL